MSRFVPLVTALLARGADVDIRAKNGWTPLMNACLLGQGDVAKTLLEESLYGLSQEIGSNAVEVYVHRLRRHLSEIGATVQVHTVRGVGYMIAEDKAA